MQSTGTRLRCWRILPGLGLCLAMGCQTWFAGQTLPSPHYLDHAPQYFAPSPPFPLSRELAAQETINAAPASAAAGLPPAVVAPNFQPGGQ